MFFGGVLSSQALPSPGAALALSLLSCLQAQAQTAVFENRSIYQLDPNNQQSTRNRNLEKIVSSDDMQSVVEFSEQDIVRKLARPVGRLAIALKGKGHVSETRMGYCTASLITTEQIITSYHCVADAVPMHKGILTMGYVKPRSFDGVVQYRVSLPPVEASAALGYAILRVAGEPGKTWGTIPLGTGTPADKGSLFVIHYPGGYPQYITRGRCRAGEPAVDGDSLFHVCDTLPGSSGAPIFDNNTLKVIGLHDRSVTGKELNGGKRLTRIASVSAILRPMLNLKGDNGTFQTGRLAQLQATSRTRAVGSRQGEQDACFAAELPRSIPEWHLCADRKGSY